MTEGYPFEVHRELSENEVLAFIGARYSGLAAIHSRYLPEVDLKNGVPSRPEYLDALRTSWLLDKSDSKPPHVALVRALGTALGLILCDTFRMKWCVIKDPSGEVVSLVGCDLEGGQFSVPPFSYVEKREYVQDSEVFVNLFNLLASKLARTSV